MTRQTSLFIVASLFFAVTIARAQVNWPQWRGPARTGAAAPDAAPPSEWSESKNVKWKVKLPGSGSSTPIVWEDKIFIQTAVPAADKPAAAAAAGDAGNNAAATATASATATANGDGTVTVKTTGDGQATAVARTGDEIRVAQSRGGRDGRDGRDGAGPGGGRGGRGGRGFGGGAPPTTPYRFLLLCIDRNTGKTLWEQTARELVPHEGHHRDHGFSSHSPVTDGTHVWAYFGSRGLHCYDMTGKRIWDKDLGKQSTRASFGEGSSPALHGDTIVVNWDHEGEDFIAAFDKKTGNEKWRQKRDEPTSWTTPLIVEHDGKAQVIVPGTNRVRAYDLATGKEVWHYKGLTQNVIPTPVAADGVVYVTSGFRGAALAAIMLGKEGDLTGTDAVLWTREKATPYVPSPLLDGERLYLFSGNSGILSCFDVKTGKPLIDTQRIDSLDNVYASPVAAGGKLYFVGRDGTTVVMKHDGDKLEEVAVNELDDPIDASPAVVGRELLLRGRTNLYCISE